MSKIIETTIRSESKLIKKKIVGMTNRAYFLVNPKILFKSKAILKRSGKKLNVTRRKKFCSLQVKMLL